MRIWLWLALVTLPTSLFAKVDSIYPFNSYYPDSVGLLYPGFPMAAGVNPAALQMSGRGTAIQIAYSPPPGYGGHQFGVALAHSKGMVGFGAGYQGILNGSLQSNAFAGLGAKVENFAFGIGARTTALESGINPMLDAGIIAELKIVDVGLVFYNLNGLPQMGVGFGTKSGHRFNLEANVLLPPFSMMDSSYLVTVSAQLTAGILSVYFRTTYTTGAGTIGHTIGLGGWVGEFAYLGLQYSTTQRLTAALTFSF